MRALQAHDYGEPTDVMSVNDVEVPSPGQQEVLVRVRATTLNFPDLLMVRGGYQVKAQMPFTPGVELCGEIVSLGADVGGWQVGDRVIGGSVLPHGGFAELAVMSPGDMHPAPLSLDDCEAAALQYAYQTGWFALHRRAQIKSGETLLVHAAAGGVGSAAVQLGKAAGAFVIGVVGGEEKVAVARELGADIVIDRRTEDFVQVVKDVTDGRCADVVFDPVGGDAYRGSTKCIAFEGRIVLIGFAGGEIQSAALNHALIKNYSILGLQWGVYRTKDPEGVRACHDELTQLVEAGLIRPLISERIALDAVADGLRRLGAGSTIGRVSYLA